MDSETRKLLQPLRSCHFIPQLEDPLRQRRPCHGARFVSLMCCDMSGIHCLPILEAKYMMYPASMSSWKGTSLLVPMVWARAEASVEADCSSFLSRKLVLLLSAAFVLGNRFSERKKCTQPM